MTSRYECHICGTEFRSADACARHVVDECLEVDPPTKTPTVSSVGGRTRMSPTKQRISGGCSSKIPVSRRLFIDDDVDVSNDGTISRSASSQYEAFQTHNDASKYAIEGKTIITAYHGNSTSKSGSLQGTPTVDIVDEHGCIRTNVPVSEIEKKENLGIASTAILRGLAEMEDYKALKKQYPDLSPDHLKALMHSKAAINAADGLTFQDILLIAEVSSENLSKDHPMLEPVTREENAERKDLSMKLEKMMDGKESPVLKGSDKALRKQLERVTKSYRLERDELRERSPESPGIKNYIDSQARRFGEIMEIKIDPKTKKPYGRSVTTGQYRRIPDDIDEYIDKNGVKRFRNRHTGRIVTDPSKDVHEKEKKEDKKSSAKAPSANIRKKRESDENSNHQENSKTAPPSFASSGRSSAWNDFQRRAKGLTMEEKRAMYAGGKTSNAEIRSALRKKKRAEQERSDHALARKLQESENSSSRTAPSPPASSGRSSAWNDFQRRAKGLTMEEKRAMYAGGKTSNAEIRSALRKKKRAEQERSDHALARKLQESINSSSRRAPSPPASSGRSNNTWNDFQRRSAGLGLSMEEKRAMYAGGKTSNAEIRSALRKKKRAEQERSDHALARKLQESVNSSSRRAPSPPASSGRSNTWNDFQRRSAGLGLSREEKRAMYHNGMRSDADIQRALGRSSVAAPSSSRTPSNPWNDFQRRSAGLGLSREEKRAMYHNGKTSDADIQRARGRSSVAAPPPRYGIGGFGGGDFGGGGFGGGGFGGGGFGGGGRPSGTHHSRGSANGRQIFTGPRGGRYTINGNGNKTYL